MTQTTQRALVEARIAALFDRLPALAVADLAGLGRIFTMATGDLLCDRLFSPCGLSILLDGRAELSLASQPVMEIGVGDCFGEEAAMDMTPPAVTIHALDAGRFWQIPRNALRDYLATHSDVANRMFLSLLRQTADRLAHSNALYADAKTQADEFQRMLEPRTQYLVDHDVLTGLLNRLALHDEIDRIIAHASVKPGGLAVFVLDLDGFEVINDLYGHVAGDQVLIEIAARLTTLAGRSEIVARIGGDEFVVLQQLPRLHGEPFPYALVGLMADQLMAAVSKPFRIREIEDSLSVSLGVALFPFDGKRAEDLVRHAELAVRSAKGEGGGHFLPFTSHLGRKATRSNHLKADLRRAVDRGELDLYFQPQLGLAEGQVVGVEALVRWRHPVFGVISPTEFVPLAEQSGLISPVGEWVMQRVGEVALAANASTPRQVRFAVNISPIQFRHRKIDDIILRHYQKQSVPPEWLTIEITEGALLHDAASAASALDRLRAAGFGVSVDDFGAGYASLSYLAQLSASEVKIDRSFIQRLGGSGMSVRDKDMVLVKAIVSMTHSLGLSVIAEGVENLEQLTQLRALGCDGIQGYLFCKPLKEQDLLNFLRQPVCVPDVRRLPGDSTLDHEGYARRRFR